MSAFLGPIHYWLYHKIQLQQDIVDELYIIGNHYGLSLEAECNSTYGVFVNKPLEEIIDLSNIHGWLQERVTQVEYKYAYSITRLLKQNPSLIEELRSLMYRKGSELGSSEASGQPNATRLFQIISDNLLDGMPCDHANRLTSQSEDEVIWTRNLCVHTNYWNEVSGDISIYYELREAWIEGLAEQCGYSFSRLDSSTYRIFAK
jgi:hypothetical protein